MWCCCDETLRVGMPKIMIVTFSTVMARNPLLLGCRVILCSHTYRCFPKQAARQLDNIMLWSRWRENILLSCFHSWRSLCGLSLTIMSAFLQKINRKCSFIYAAAHKQEEEASAIRNENFKVVLVMVWWWATVPHQSRAVIWHWCTSLILTPTSFWLGQETMLCVTKTDHFLTLSLYRFEQRFINFVLLRSTKGTKKLTMGPPFLQDFVPASCFRWNVPECMVLRVKCP